MKSAGVLSAAREREARERKRKEAALWAQVAEIIARPPPSAPAVAAAPAVMISPPKPAATRRGGRPKVYASGAERQKAYRARRKERAT